MRTVLPALTFWSSPSHADRRLVYTVLTAKVPPKAATPGISTFDLRGVDGNLILLAFGQGKLSSATERQYIKTLICFGKRQKGA